MNSKRAQSEIITTVLIILLVLAAIIIVWQVVQGTVSKGGNTATEQANCIGVAMTVTPATVNAKSGTFIVKREAQGDTFTNASVVVLVNGLTTPSTDYTASLTGDIFKAPLTSTTLTVNNKTASAADLTKVEVALKVGDTICGAQGSWEA